MLKQPKVAIVYDWIDKWGGVERLLLVLHEVFPDAVFYTSYYDKKNASWAQNLIIRESFLRFFPLFIKRNRILSLPFFSYAFESFDFTEFDTVISVTSSFAKSIITKPGTKHISIFLTPTRYFWNDIDSYISGFKKAITLSFFQSFRRWDYIAAHRPDRIYSISQEVKKRVKKYYGLDTKVLYPPFDLDYWKNIQTKLPNTNGEYYLVVSRLEPYKRIDLVIKTFNALKDKHLVIIGKGTRENSLKKLAGNTIHFYKDISDSDLAVFYIHAKALIMPQEEEFGYTALESQFFDCPVIAFNKGGAKETILDKNTGLFFDFQTQASLTHAIEKYEKLSYTLKNYLKKNKKKHLEKFSKETFIKQVLEIL